MVDGAPPHCAKLVEDLSRENKEIKIIYLPKESPYINAVEEGGRMAKRASCLKTLQNKTGYVEQHIGISQNGQILPDIKKRLPENSNMS